MDKLVQIVREYAQSNYGKDGWDILVECWDDAQIILAIGRARTPKTAIAAVRQTVTCVDDYRRDIQNA